MSSKMNYTIVDALESLIALASAHLVKYSVAVMMYQAPVRFPVGLIGPTKSIATRGAKGISSLLEGFPTLWHTL
jgi:hypothetical protein